MHGFAQCYHAPVRIAAWGVAGGGTLGLLFLALCALWDAGDASMPVSGDPGDPGDRYAVAVLGDTQKGLGSFADLLVELRKSDPALYLHSGDLVSRNDEGHYRLAARALRKAGLGRPLWVAPGNHDVKDGTDRFRKAFGRLEDVRVLGKVAYVLVDNHDGTPPPLERLDALMAGAPPHETAVVVMHVPPIDLEGNLHPPYAPFMEWLGRNRVSYLMCGHIHDYVRREIGDTVVIANGVGGDYDSWQLEQAVYATLLEVDGASVTDRAVRIPPRHGILENLEHLAVGHVAEGFRRRPAVSWTGTVLLLLLTVGAVRVARRKAA